MLNIRKILLIKIITNTVNLNKLFSIIKLD